jgi:hypothetical protein
VPSTAAAVALLYLALPRLVTAPSTENSLPRDAMASNRIAIDLRRLPCCLSTCTATVILSCSLPPRAHATGSRLHGASCAGYLAVLASGGPFISSSLLVRLQLVRLPQPTGGEGRGSVPRRCALGSGLADQRFHCPTRGQRRMRSGAEVVDGHASAVVAYVQVVGVLSPRANVAPALQPEQIRGRWVRDTNALLSEAH